LKPFEEIDPWYKCEFERRPSKNYFFASGFSSKPVLLKPVSKNRFRMKNRFLKKPV
jgi:hypothetical protein